MSQQFYRLIKCTFVLEAGELGEEGKANPVKSHHAEMQIY